MKTLTAIKILSTFLIVLFIISNLFVSFNSPAKLVEEKIKITIK